MNVLYVLPITTISEVHGPDTFIHWMDNLPDHVRARLVVSSADEEVLRACDRIRIPTVMAPIQETPLSHDLAIIFRCALVGRLGDNDLIVHLPVKEIGMFEKLGDQYRSNLKSALNAIASAIDGESNCHVGIRRIGDEHAAVVICYRMQFLRSILSQKLTKESYKELINKELPTHIPAHNATKIELFDPLCDR